MLPHIDSVCRTGFFQLRQLRTVRGSLTTECAQTMVHSFISSRLDYCKSLPFGISAERIKRLQSVQNAAARLVSETRKFDRITHVLQNVHWLLVANAHRAQGGDVGPQVLERESAVLSG